MRHALAGFLAIVVLPLAVAVALAGAPAEHVIATGKWEPQTYAQGPPDNPLKGFMPYRSDYREFPHSMEWGYIPWEQLQQGENVFTWKPLEAFLDDIAGRGHQAAFRIYADYPNIRSGLPAFLSGVARHSYSDHENGRDATSVSPDYDDPRLVRAMLQLIAALGARYDGDPRIGFITVGFIGFWGEWHTHRPSCDCDEWMPSPATLRAVLKAFDRAFDHTRLLVRYPDVGWDGERVGFHDDSFAYLTIGPDWMFMGKMRSAGALRQWRREPIGGELRPEVQPCAFSLPACTPAGQDFARSVDVTHASWLLDHYAFAKGHTGADRARAEAGARRLGYDLFVSAVKLKDAKARDDLKVEVRLQNRGVAPFYYDWPVWIGLADEHGQLVKTSRTGWKITRVVDPDDDETFRTKLKDHRLRPGVYTVLMRAENPLPNGKPLAFANAAWGEDVAGWLTLGHVRVAQ